MMPTAALLSLLLAAPQVDQVPAIRAKMHTYRDAEALRQKNGFCKTANNTRDINACLALEMDKTKANYLGYTRAFSQFLRLRFDGTNPSGTVRRIPFDTAESAWTTYRDRTCEVSRDLFAGGTGAPAAYASCYLALTGSHMKDLGELFSDNS